MRARLCYLSYALGALMVIGGVATIFASFVDPSIAARPELATGGASLVLATGLVAGGNNGGRDGNARADTRRKKRR